MSETASAVQPISSGLTLNQQLSAVAAERDKLAAEMKALKAQLSATVTFKRGTFNGKPMLEVSGLGTKPLNHGLRVWQSICDNAASIQGAITGFAELPERDAR